MLDRWLDELAGVMRGSSGAGPSVDLPEEALLRLSMRVKLRYVECRIHRSAAERWYWYRRGHKLVRLPNNSIEGMAAAGRLNVSADDRSQIIPRQRQIPGFKPWHSEILQRVPARHRSAPPGTAVPLVYPSQCSRIYQGLREGIPAAPMGCRPKQLANLARHHGIVAADESAALCRKTYRPRDGFGPMTNSPSAEDPHIMTAFLLLQFTAQRPRDVFRIAWPQYAVRRSSCVNKRSARCSISPSYADGCEADLLDAEI
jgi:hypothetical protein